MDIDVKKEARAQYLRYFKVWFIIAGVLLVICVVFAVQKALVKENANARTNYNAPQERVYDQANVLSEEEENKLRAQIAEKEALIQCDIVVLTINQPVEGMDAQEKYGYRYVDWEWNMRDIADDFYDNNNFGYYTGSYDGVLLLDNWYEGQAGSWLSTSGAVYEKFGEYYIDLVLDEVYSTIERGGSAYEAYSSYVDEVVYLMQKKKSSDVSMSSFVLGGLIISTIASLIFIFSKLKVKEGDVTTNVNTYVDGKARVNVSTDNFIRKTVTTRVIPRNNSSGGGSHHSSSGGRGGSHRSSSGRSHGGGGRRR